MFHSPLFLVEPIGLGREVFGAAIIATTIRHSAGRGAESRVIFQIVRHVEVEVSIAVEIRERRRCAPEILGSTGHISVTSTNLPPPRVPVKPLVAPACSRRGQFVRRRRNRRWLRPSHMSAPGATAWQGDVLEPASHRGCDRDDRKDRLCQASRVESIHHCRGKCRPSHLRRHRKSPRLRP